MLPTFVEYLDERKNDRKLAAVKGAGHLIGLLPYLFALDTDAQAVIAAKLTFDKVFSPRKKNQLVISVTESIGSAIEAECQMQYYERLAPPLFAVFKRKLLASS